MFPLVSAQKTCRQMSDEIKRRENFRLVLTHLESKAVERMER